jgi:hypothetical protein
LLNFLIFLSPRAGRVWNEYREFRAALTVEAAARLFRGQDPKRYSRITQDTGIASHYAKSC